VGAGGLVYFACLWGFGIFNRQSLKALFPKRTKRGTIERIEGEIQG